jgi:hypothetical protein
MPFLLFMPPREEFLDYEVNAVVDNSSTKGACPGREFDVSQFVWLD